MELSAYFELQYELIRESRDALLSYCSTISDEDLQKEMSGFGHSSIRNLLVHVANCYQVWMSRALQQPFVKTEFAAINTIAEIHALYGTVNDKMKQFIDFIDKENPEILALNQYGKIRKFSPMTLFSHVITHEFHHKGQILSISRQLGYIPVDSDIIR